MAINNQYQSSVSLKTWGGVSYTRYYITPPASGDQAIVLVPDSLPEGAPANLVQVLHGRGASHTSLYSGVRVRISDMLLEKGYIVVAPYMHGDSWGNRTAQNDINALYDWVNNIWPVATHGLYAESMGGNAATNAIRLKERPIKGALLIAPSIDLQDVWDRNTAGHDGLEAAFNLSSTATASQVTTAITPWNTMAQPGSDFSHVPIKIYTSLGDATVNAAENTIPWSDKVRAVGGKIDVTLASGGHMDLSHFYYDQITNFFVSLDKWHSPVLKQWTGTVWKVLDYRDFNKGIFRVCDPISYIDPTKKGTYTEATVNVNASIRSYRSTSQPVGTTVSSRTVNKPFQTSAGDLILMYTLADSGSTGDFVVPTNFTEIGRVIGANNAVRLIASYRVATDNEPATYLYQSVNGSARVVSMTIAVKDWSGNTADIRGAFSPTTNTSLNTPTVTPATNRNLLLTTMSSDDNVEPWIWGWIPPKEGGNVGYMHHDTYWVSGAVSQEIWNSTLPTGIRTWSVNTSSTQTNRMSASVVVPSGAVTKSITEFLKSSVQTQGEGGPKTDAYNLVFDDSTGLRSTYHLFADGLDWNQSVGLMVYTDGSGEWGLADAQITAQSPYLLHGTNGLINVAKRQNMVLLTPRAPGDNCNDLEGVCWYDHSLNNTTPWQKMEWSNELIRDVLKRYNIDRRRIAIGGYSSGAQWTMSWWGPKYGSEVMVGGVAVGISYGGQPRVNPRITDTYKKFVAHVWNVGALDDAYAQPTWDDGVNTGRAWYQNNGFAVTDLDVVPNTGHAREDANGVGPFGTIMENAINKYMMKPNGTMPEGPPVSGGTATLRSISTSATPSTNSNKSTAKPAGVVAGDFLLMIFTAYGTNATNGALPAGFTLLNKHTRSTVHSSWIGYKVATASEPASYTPTVPSGNSHRTDLIAYQNIDVSNLGVPAVVTTAAATSHNAPSVTPTSSSGILISFVSGGGGNTWTPPASMTELSDAAADTNSTYLTLSTAQQAITSSSATGTKNFVASTNSYIHIAGSLFIPSAPVGASTTPAVPTTYQATPSGGTTGILEDRNGVVFEASSYHIRASHLVGQAGPFPVIFHWHGDGAGEFSNTTSGPFPLYEIEARRNNAIFILARTPDNTNPVTWWEDSASVTYSVNLMNEIFGKYNVDKKRVFLSGYSGGAELISFNHMVDYHTLFEGGGAMMLGGGGVVYDSANNLKVGFTGIPSTTLREQFFMNWEVGDQDNGVAPSDTTINALKSSTEGEEFYRMAGFKTERNVIPGENHFGSEDYGPARLTNLINKSNAFYGLPTV